jgi:hypothetical protein
VEYKQNEHNSPTSWIVGSIVFCVFSIFSIGLYNYGKLMNTLNENLMLLNGLSQMFLYISILLYLVTCLKEEK